MSHIESQRIVITTAGDAGSAEGEEDTIPIEGFLLDIRFDYHASAPATTDVTIADPIFGDLLVKSNNATDFTAAPREPIVDAAGAATGLFDLIPLNSELTISVSETDALTACVVLIIRWLTP